VEIFCGRDCPAGGFVGMRGGGGCRGGERGGGHGRGIL